MTLGPGGARRAVRAGLVAAALLVVGCSSGSTAVEQPASSSTTTTTTSSPAAPEGFPTATLAVTRADGTATELSVLVADTQPQRSRGLMGVTDPGLGGHDAMVFVFPGDTTSAFWMKDTLLPLSIAWFGADGAFVDRADMEPCPTGAACPTFAPSGAYRYAVEVPLGALDGLGLADGSTIALGAR